MSIRFCTVARDTRSDWASAVTTIEIHGRSAAGVLRALKGLPEVRTLHTTNGRWDIIAELRADTLEAFDRTLDRVRLIDGISATETSILLSTYKL